MKSFGFVDARHCREYPQFTRLTGLQVISMAKAALALDRASRHEKLPLCKSTFGLMTMNE